jgi:alkylation response protein AidB-like acyl-CoA dehydrogenase
MSGGTTIGLPPIVKYGTDEQKRQWLPGIFTGETSFCLGATEPSGMTLDDDVSVVTN